MNSTTLKDEVILYLEDDDVLAQITGKALAKRNYKVVHVSTLDAAKATLGNYNFDCALLDLKLESETSLALIPELKRHNQAINILVLTGYASIATAVQAVKLGATNYLSKPATIDDIINGLSGTDAELENEAPISEKMSVKRLEWEHIQRVLAENSGNISATARQLKMHRRTLQRKLQKKPISD